MKFKNIIVLLAAIPVIGIISPISEVKANDVDVSIQEKTNTQFEVIEVSKEQIISDYAESNNISFEEASNILFPAELMTRGAQFRSVSNNDDTSYVMFRAAAQYTTRTQNLPAGAGQVYFYCQVSTSGGFRAIQRIIYAGYNAGNLVFNGQFQYHLADPNRIHYTLNGGLYSNTTYTVTGGGSIGIGEVANANVSISATSNFVRGLYHHGDIGY